MTDAKQNWADFSAELAAIYAALARATGEAA
jgi:hypothetical protein